MQRKEPQVTNGQTKAEGQEKKTLNVNEEINSNPETLEDILTCPLSFEVYDDPVTLADGHTYEAIQSRNWISRNKDSLISPMTREPLKDRTSIKNAFVKAVVEYHEENPEQHHTPDYVDILTGKIIVDPIITRNGNTYGRAAWLDWATNNDRELLDNKIIDKLDKSNDTLISNIKARQILAHYNVTVALKENVKPEETVTEETAALEETVKPEEAVMPEETAKPELTNTQKLSEAIKKGDLKRVNNLVANNAELLTMPLNNDGDRAMHLAVLNKQLEICKALVKLGADYRVTNINGVTPLALAGKVLDEASEKNEDTEACEEIYNVLLKQVPAELRIDRESLKCSIDLEIFKLPVILSDARTYEKPAAEGMINDYLAKIKSLGHKKGPMVSPLTREAMNPEICVPNLLIAEIVKKQYHDENLYRCPLTNKIMVDPVTLSTGITYERTAIEEYLAKNNNECFIGQKKITQRPVANYLIKQLIWEHFEKNKNAEFEEKKEELNQKQKQKQKVELERKQAEAQFIQAIDANDDNKILDLLKSHPDLLIEQISKNNGLLRQAFAQSKFKAVGAILTFVTSTPERIQTFSKCQLEHNQTALHYAAYLNNVSAMQRLIESGADINALSIHGYTPLHNAASAGHVEATNLLLSCANININVQIQKDSRLGSSTPLHLAITDKKPDVVKLLLKAGADYNIRNDNNHSALDLAKYLQILPIIHECLPVLGIRHAVREGDKPQIMKILESHPRLFFEASNEHPPYILQLATQYNNSELVAELVNLMKNFSDDDLKTVAKWGFRNNQNILHIIASTNTNDVAFISRLLNMFPELINREDYTGNTPFSIAVNNENINIAEQLLICGATYKRSIYEKANEKVKPLFYRHRSLELFKVAIVNNLADEIKLLLSEMPFLFNTMFEGKTVLEYVVEKNSRRQDDIDKQHEVIKTLLEFACQDLDTLAKLASIKYKDNMNLLHLAARTNNVEIAQYCIANGIEINAENILGQTPLMIAADYGSNEVAQLLLNQPTIDCNAQDYELNTALHHAVLSQSSELVEQLLKAHADFTIRNSDHDTPLSLVKPDSDPAIYSLLYDKKSYWSKLRHYSEKIRTQGQSGKDKANMINAFLNELAGKKDRDEQIKLLIATIKGCNKYRYLTLHRSSFVFFGQETQTLIDLKGLLREIAPEYAPEQTEVSMLNNGKLRLTVKYDSNAKQAECVGMLSRLFNKEEKDVVSEDSTSSFFSHKRMCLSTTIDSSDANIEKLRKYGLINAYDNEELALHFPDDKASHSKIDNKPSSDGISIIHA